MYTVNSDLNKTINSHNYGSEEDKSDENNEKSEEGEEDEERNHEIIYSDTNYYDENRMKQMI